MVCTAVPHYASIMAARSCIAATCSVPLSSKACIAATWFASLRSRVCSERERPTRRMIRLLVTQLWQARTPDVALAMRDVAICSGNE